MGSPIAFELEEREALEFNFDVAVQGGGEPYTGEYEVTPNFEVQELATKDKQMKDNVKIQSIPVYEVSNPTGGITLTIGELENG